MATIDNRKSKEEIEEIVDDVNDTPEETPTEPDESDPVEETPEEPEPTNEEPEEPKEEPEKPTQPTVDYKERYSQSTREAQVLAAKNKKLVETIDEAANLAEPTEDELRREYSDWDQMTDKEKRLFKDNLINKRKFNLVHEAVLDARKVDEWAEKVDTFVTKKTLLDEYPQLEGKEDDFKTFAMKPSRRGVDLEDLARAYLYNADPAPPKHRGSLLETGTGGPREKETNRGYTPEEVKRIRETDQRKYQQLIKEGKIKIEL